MSDETLMVTHLVIAGQTVAIEPMEWAAGQELRVSVSAEGKPVTTVLIARPGTPPRAATPTFVSIQEAAVLLAVSPRTMARWVADGSMPSVKARAGRIRRIPIEAIRNFGND